MDELKTKLKHVVEKNKQNQSIIDIKTDNQLFEDEYLKIKYPNGMKQTSMIPTFYKKSDTNDRLQQKLREDARTQLLLHRTQMLLDNEDLKQLWAVLDTESSNNYPNDTEQMLNYNQYNVVADKVDAKCKPYFTAKVFAKLQNNDPLGRISVMALFNYIMRKVWIHQTRIGLSIYDHDGQGYLREGDFEKYIAGLIHTLPQLNGLEKSFYNFYTCTAARKFFFFLDPFGKGKIRIKDILSCNLLDELLELRDEDLAKDVQENNWFSAPSALRVYGVYLNLDQDHNGMLKKEELLKYGTGTLTEAFIERVFQECMTYEGEMDYKTYLDFVLALENRKEPQSLQYFFRILDVRHQGYLDAWTLNYFFRDILLEMEKHNQDPVKFEDVKDEIFDMVRPKDGLRITLKELIDCGNGDTVVSILIDLNGFWTYENREVLVNDNSES